MVLFQNLMGNHNGDKSQELVNYKQSDIVVGHAYNADHDSSPPYLEKGISFEENIPPIVTPPNKEEFNRRQSVVTKDFTGKKELFKVLIHHIY